MILLLSVFVKEKQENKTKNGRVDSEEHREKEIISSSNSLLNIIGFKVQTLHLILSHIWGYNSAHTLELLCDFFDFM